MRPSPYDCPKMAVPIDSPADLFLVHAQHTAFNVARAAERN